MTMEAMKTRNGRPKGSLNKNGVNARKAIANFVELNIPKFNQWLEQVATGIPKTDQTGKVLVDEFGSTIYLVKPDPTQAIKIVADVCEYHLPKLSRQDVQVTGAITSIDNMSPIGQAMLAMSGDALEAHLRSLTLADQMPSWLVPSTGSTIDAESVLVPDNGDEPK